MSTTPRRTLPVPGQCPCGGSWEFKRTLLLREVWLHDSAKSTDFILLHLVSWCILVLIKADHQSSILRIAEVSASHSCLTTRTAPCIRLSTEEGRTQLLLPHPVSHALPSLTAPPSTLDLQNLGGGIRARTPQNPYIPRCLTPSTSPIPLPLCPDGAVRDHHPNRPSQHCSCIPPS